MPLEAFRLQIVNSPIKGNIIYRAHVSDIGWQGYINNNTTAGTVGKAKSIEAVQLQLTDELATMFEGTCTKLRMVRLG